MAILIDVRCETARPPSVSSDHLRLSHPLPFLPKFKFCIRSISIIAFPLHPLHFGGGGGEYNSIRDEIFSAAEN